MTPRRSVPPAKQSVGPTKPVDAPSAAEAIALLEARAPWVASWATPYVDDIAAALFEPSDGSPFEARLREETRALDDGPVARRALRVFRHREMGRLVLLDLLRLADVDEVARGFSRVASVCTDVALEVATRTEAGRRGDVRRPGGAPARLTVLGMGKLGGGELNPGSDIDLCFFYASDDAEVAGPPGVPGSTPHEVFSRIATRTVRLVGDVTEDGFCFRVDLRLRPEGSRGPLVNSIASAERYYETWGRPWERAVLLRARPIAGDLAVGEELLDVLRPFVFRRSVDPSIAQEMSGMLRRARREAGSDVVHDLKIGPGGIRELEFFVQTLQLVWGGRHARLQVPGTLEAIQRLRDLGLLSAREHDAAERLWSFLRRLEHAIHYRAGFQTHVVPREADARRALAEELGLRDLKRFDTRLEDVRQRVGRLFRSLEPGAAAAGADERPELERICDLVSSGAKAPEVAILVAAHLPELEPDEAAAHLVRLARRADHPLGPVGRERHPTLGSRLLLECLDTVDPTSALRFTADFFTRLPAGDGYTRLLDENPRTLRRLVALFGSSPMLAEALVAQPSTIERALIDRRVPTLPDAVDEHAFEVRGLDREAFVSRLRSARRDTLLAAGMAYVSSDLELLDVQRLVSALADLQVRQALEFAGRSAHAKRGVAVDTEGALRGVVVLGLGKLGAREMGFTSDLDLFFVHGRGDERDGAGDDGDHALDDVFADIARHTLRLLSEPAAEGPGWDTDARLRPSGSAGLLAVSLRSFERYYATAARTWERQAMLRARVVAGDPALGSRLHAAIDEVAYGGPEPNAGEVADMRRRLELELARETEARWHAKLGYGALVDAEFTVQWLQMKYGRADPSLRVVDTLSALSALERGGYMAASTARALVDGLVFFRRVEQAFRLLDKAREPVAGGKSRVEEQVARHLGFRDRESSTAADALATAWARRARTLRSLFEQLVAPVGTRAPFASS